MPTNFPPPVNVSPLIRFGRYSMLLVGLGYGAFWQSRYTKKELGLKDIKAKEKAARDARLAQEKARRSADDAFVVVPNSVDEAYNVETDADKDEIRKPCPDNSFDNEKPADPINVGAEPEFDKTKISNNDGKVTSTSSIEQKEMHSENLNNDNGDSVIMDSKIKVDVVKNILSQEKIVIKKNEEKDVELKIVKDLRERFSEEPHISSVKENNIIDQSISSIDSVVKEINKSFIPNSEMSSKRKSQFLGLTDRSKDIPEEPGVWPEEKAIHTKNVSELFEEDQKLEETISLDSKLLLNSYSSQPLNWNISSLLLYVYGALIDPARDNQTNFENSTDELPDHSDFEDFIFLHGPS